MHPTRFFALVISASFACALALPSSVRAAGDEAKQVFDSLFAAKIKAVNATADRADDVVLAKQLVTLAKTSTTQPGLLALLCDTAYDLGFRTADGYATAIEAQELLAEHVEEKRDGAREKLITLLTRQMAAGKADEREGAGESLIRLLVTMGDEKLEKKQYTPAVADLRRAVTIATQKKSASLDEVKAKVEFATARDRAAKSLARLEEKLLKDANDFATAEEIVKVYVIEFDDPAGAAPFLNRVKDEQLRLFVPLAAKDIVNLSAGESLQLGEWYKRFVDPSRITSAAYAVHRAERYLSRFLELDPAEGVQRTKAEVLLKDVQATKTQLDRANIQLSPSGKLPEYLRDAVLVYSFDQATLEKRDSKYVIRDISGFGNDGEIDSVKVTVGIAGNALILDAANDVVRSKNAIGIAGDSPRTVSYWLKVNKERTNDDLGSFVRWGGNSPGGQFAIAARKGQFFLWGYGEGHDWFDVMPVAAVWQHHIVTYDGRTVRWYVNGDAVRNTFDHRYATQDSYLMIGSGNVGMIDELAIFKRAVTSEEAQKLYQASKRGLAREFGKRPTVGK